MNRLLWRLLPLTGLVLLLASAAVYLVFIRLYGDPREDIARRQSAGQIFLLEQYIDQAPPDEWLQRLNTVREVSPQQYELWHLAEVLPRLSAQQQQDLQAGELVMDVEARAFWRRVDLSGQRYVDSDHEVLRVGRLPVDVADVWRREAIRLGVVTLFLIVPLAGWSRAHWRDLLALSRTVQGWAEGRLEARAPQPGSASLQPLAMGMNHMAAQLQAVLEGRRALLHAVSHELRTPLARLGFGLELLREAESPAQQAARLDAMTQDLEELQALVTELLSYSRLEQSPLQPVPIDLAVLLNQVLARAERDPCRRSIQFEVAGDIGQMAGDPRWVARAIGNLWGNALKYARHRVALKAEAWGDTHWRLTVEDDGPGIPAAERARIFDPFVRLARPEDRGLSGHGLGLAIVARIVALHGAQLHIEDSAWGGARFIVVWPRHLRPGGTGGEVGGDVPGEVQA